MGWAGKGEAKWRDRASYNGQRHYQCQGRVNLEVHTVVFVPA